MQRKSTQLDVFSLAPMMGNPVAVVHEAAELSDEDLAAFARWTNLSETTFLLPATEAGADYRVRIFTPGAELPFAGHPTLGSAHDWLEAGGVPAQDDVIIQECGIGLVQIRRGDRLAFAAPEFVRSGPVEPSLLEAAINALGIESAAVEQSQWIDNGPGRMGLRLRDAQLVLSLDPDFAAMSAADLLVGVLGRYAAGGPADVEVRAFPHEPGH